MTQLSDYKDPISIHEAISKIDDRSFLLPAIQRNFIWNTQQICSLFDSMMRGYPINSFMTWNVTSQQTKNDYRFYSFISDYCQRFKESNDLVQTRGQFKNFLAIIDGQQRLTSIYIGLKGSYAYKQSRKHWPSTRNDTVLPPRELYLDLSGELNPEENEGKLKFHFRFLTKTQVEAYSKDSAEHWFRVGDILNFGSVESPDAILLDHVIPYLKEFGLETNRFALRSLTSLYSLVRTDKLIRYYQEESQSIDHVLDVFIRTNSGGTPLDFADLLMSIAVASWDGDARKDIDSLIKEVRQDVDMNFSISRDWVLKTCLMLTNADIKFRVQNFDRDRVRVIQEQWETIRECVTQTFKFLRLIGMNDQSIRAKNAIIPIVYYLFKQRDGQNPLYMRINNLNHHDDERTAISKWLNMALLKGVFGGQSDTILGKMRNTIDSHLEDSLFPLTDIVIAFENTSKDLRFDEGYLNTLLEIEYGDARCRSVLSLLFPKMNNIHTFHIDHLHPQKAFKKRELDKHDFLERNPELSLVYSNKKNWNSILNLHLLDDNQNLSKKAKPLKDWMSEENTKFVKADLLLPIGASLEFEDFKQFCEIRKIALMERLRNNVLMSEDLSHAEDPLDELSDEE